MSSIRMADASLFDNCSLADLRTASPIPSCKRKGLNKMRMEAEVDELQPRNLCFNTHCASLQFLLVEPSTG